MKRKSKKRLKLLISTGGTGGHIFPALAIANAFKKKYGNYVDILFVGSRNNIESRVVPKEGYDIKYINVRGLNRKNIFSNISLLFIIFFSLIKSFFILKSFKPDVVLGMGSYVSGPVLFMASMIKIKTIIHEQNAKAGLTNKILSKYVNKICVAFDNMSNIFPHRKIVKTGNPIRQEIFNLNTNANKSKAYKYFNFSSSKKTVFFMGGSLGAKAFNEFLTSHIDFFKNNNIQLIWQCGKIYRSSLNIDSDLDGSIYLSEFINNINYAYIAADIIVSRAGAGSISELTCIAKPSILIPSPNVVSNHQFDNALVMSLKEAAILISEHKMEEELIPAISNLLNDRDLCIKLSKNISSNAIVDATEKIITEIIKLSK